ncbi:MAG: MFS transporter [candidate division WOR-3 bacterium]|nr:MFS transporter [candidate division WOR-3 bacterium]MDH5683184.1 MFS transporter [candidate division WOR-3 bacterium]
MLNVILLGITSLLTDASTEMVYPLIPLYLSARLGASPAIIGLIEGIAESLASLLKVFSGNLSDRIRRRRPLAIFGYSFSSIGKLILYLANAWGGVLIARVVDRFGKGVRTAPRDALIADSTPSNKLGMAYGLHRAMDTIGAAIGVTLAIILMRMSQSNYPKVFLFALIPALLGVFFLFFTKERLMPNKVDKKQPLLNWRVLPRRLKFFLLIIFLFALGNSSNQFLLLRAKDLGFSIFSVLLVYLFYNLMFGIFAFPIGKFSDRIGRKKVLIIGYLVYGLAYLGFAVAFKPEMVWLLFGIYGLYSAFTQGVEKALVAEIAPETIRGTMIGLHATVVGIGLFPASLLAGLLWNIWGASAPFYFGGVLGFISALGLALVL